MNDVFDEMYLRALKDQSDAENFSDMITSYEKSGRKFGNGQILDLLGSELSFQWLLEIGRKNLVGIDVTDDTLDRIIREYPQLQGKFRKFYSDCRVPEIPEGDVIKDCRTGSPIGLLRSL